MSSGPRPCTGTRECPDSTTTGRMRVTGSLRRTNTICARGTMMSRTLRSADLEHPLEHGERIGIDQAAFARLAQHPQELGAVLRLGEPLREALQPAAGGVQVLGHRVLGAPVGVGETEPAQHRDLAALHAARIRVTLVVIADQVQRAVHHQVRPVRAAVASPGRAPRCAAPARR